ncbi:MAG TPA: carboxymuconolactone decarboxylase family protein [Streptosporangiaceae bacterium]|nr:carboxymuconolactone decarboxylase family protein [Streptosporangiaceae bacterium]
MNYPASYTSTVSVPLPDDDAIRSVVGDTYDPGTALNVIKMFAGTGDLYPALIGMVNAIFGTNDIDAKHREMIILRAAKVLDTPYEWQANVTLAGNAGLSDADICAAASDGSVTGIDPEYVLICRATDELSQAHTLTDETLTTLLDTFGVVTTRRYVAMIAWFNLLSLFLNGTRVPLETTDKIGNRTSPI